MTIHIILSTIAAVLVCLVYIPYARDIMRGKAIPSRSARLMLTVLIVIALLQQVSLHVGWTMAVTAGEVVGSIAILVLALYKGIGCLKRLDIICYVLLALDLALWLGTKNTLLALHLTMLADTIAFYPTVIKTWRNPDSETPLFFAVGMIAPLLSLIYAGQYTYTILAFPLYLALANGLELLIIYTRSSPRDDAILAE